MDLTTFLCSICRFTARSVNCGSQKQGHTYATFNWCGKEIALVGFGMNSMGAHFNPVSISIVNSESKQGIKSSYKATCSGLYTLYNSAWSRPVYVTVQNVASAPKFWLR